MDRDLGRLVIEKAIVHEIPRRTARTAGGSPVLSEIESPLNVEIKNYFAERIKASLSTAAYNIAFDDDSSSPVPECIQEMLTGSASGFVERSRRIATHLYDCQSGVNPGGLLTIIAAKIERASSIAVLKLEKEAGLRAHQAEHDGKTTFDMEHIRELMLTDRTRVFKVAVFARNTGRPDEIEGVASDHQRGFQPKTEIADFFLRRFLGCKLREAPEITTKLFFNATQQFINEHVGSAETRARYEIALLAEMNSTEAIVRPRAFANRNLETEDRQCFISVLEEQNVNVAELEKDTALIRSKLKRIEVKFCSGIALHGSPDAFEEYVTIDSATEGQSRVEIRDEIKNVGGRG